MQKRTIWAYIAAAIQTICCIICGYQTVQLLGMEDALLASHPSNPEISIEYLYNCGTLFAFLAIFLIVAFVTIHAIKSKNKTAVLLLLHGILLVISVVAFRLSWAHEHNLAILVDEALFRSPTAFWVLFLQIPVMVATVISFLGSAIGNAK